MNGRSATTAVALAALWVLAGPAQAAASPSRGVSAVVMSQATLDGRDYIMRELIIEPGGSTGWHWHQGRLFGVIKQGTLTHQTADCHVDGIYHAGDPITEAVGADHAHIGRNLGDAPVVMQVLYIKPAGSPLSDDAPDPGCGFD